MKSNEPKALFYPADILLPKDGLESWAVIACDQFSSNPEYWDEVTKLTAGKRSALNLILPEAWLDQERGWDHKQVIDQSMKEYLDDDFFVLYPQSMIYIERILQDGSVRKGLIGAIDLEDYEFTPDSKAPIKATEKTIVERIPAREAIRSQALIEVPHILLLADDGREELLDFDTQNLKKLYDFPLMLDGGNIRGWLLDEEAMDDFFKKLSQYQDERLEKNQTLFFAVGDGNHSLAAAKSHWNHMKEKLIEQGESDLISPKARYALVELENLQEDSQKFEPIHRIVRSENPTSLISYLSDEQGNTLMEYFENGIRKSFTMEVPEGMLSVAVFQEKLDDYARDHDIFIDYIHGEDELESLSKDRTLGFLMHGIDKGLLFSTILEKGVLPRKTFSMGHAKEKRYYLESRKIKAD